MGTDYSWTDLRGCQGKVVTSFPEKTNSKKGLDRWRMPYFSTDFMRL